MAVLKSGSTVGGSPIITEDWHGDIVARNLVPRVGGEGSLGRVDKRWGAVFAVGGSFTGDVEVPTQEVSDSSNLAASTEFVKTAVDYYLLEGDPA